MTSEKPNPPINFSDAKDGVQSMNLENMPDTGEVHEVDKGEVHEDTLKEPEINEEENVAQRQMNIANIPGAGIVSLDEND
jgi:hypothetical protein